MSSENFDIPQTLPAVHFDIFTLFPAMFVGPLTESILKRAQEKRLIGIAIHDIRAYTTDRHHVCDDTPYGGGGGMVMKPEPIVRAVETVLAHAPGWALAAEESTMNLPPWNPDTPVISSQNTLAQPESLQHRSEETSVILLTPQGRLLNQSVVAELSQLRRLALICGRYEGVDERVRSQVVTDEISIGDYVLSGGELAAMVIVDAVTRLLPGALGYECGALQDSHSPGLDGLLEGPQYTRPPIFRAEAVPDILLSGHHGNVARWRREQALLRTLARRPELLSKLPLTDADRAFLSKWGWRTESDRNE
jgi:tRNA (guanine37-N1)-methyltransferase